MSYPPLTLAVNVDLDVHTGEFIAPLHRCAPAQAVLQLQPMPGRFFVARLAPLNINWELGYTALARRPLRAAERLREEIIWVPVLREIHYEAQGLWVMAETCLVCFHDSSPRLPRGEVASSQQIEKFWRDHTAVVDMPSTGSSYRVFLGGSIKLARCYYHQPSGLGLAMFAWGDCWWADLQESSPDLREEVRDTYVGIKWMKGNPDDEGKEDLSSSRRDLADLSPTEFNGKVEALLHQSHSELRYAAEFYQTDEEGRCLEVLKCGPLVRRLAQKKCEVEVLHAMNSDGELDGCTYVRCTPWVDRPLKVATPTVEWKTMAVPPALQQNFAAIFSQLGVAQPLPAPPTGGSPESLRQKVRFDWAARIHFEVEAGSAHEIAAAVEALQREIEMIEKELATMSAT